MLTYISNSTIIPFWASTTLNLWEKNSWWYLKCYNVISVIYFCIHVGHSPIHEVTKSVGIQIKASTEHHCTGLTLTTSYTNLFFLLLNITCSTSQELFLIASCFLGWFPPLLLLLFLCHSSITPQDNDSGHLWMPVMHLSLHEHNHKATWKTFSHQFFLVCREHAEVWQKYLWLEHC